ncbi:uncharacterized protein LOC100906260 [Galendromus occidentalis]|uniref:Uncharacterized protein LOC100906260 n=1 Tax=Galendromus occidentalis TaxID=34638 RepID=A0AAJ6QS68_9ACAR|nr:uncharacterized protein LOC100906260 [Galendromus occidentalis]
MRLSLCLVLVSFIYASQGQLTQNTVESLDKVIDVVLDLVRVDSGLNKLFSSIRVPLNLTEDGIRFHDLTLSNVLSLYRGGESFIDLQSDQLITNTTFEARNLTVDLQWTAKKWFVTLVGTAQLKLEAISVNTAIGVEGLRVSLIDACVPEFDSIEVIKVTGTSSVFNNIVRDVVQKIVNTESTKNMISEQVVDTIRKLFNQIFK